MGNTASGVGTAINKYLQGGGEGEAGLAMEERLPEGDKYLGFVNVMSKIL